MMPQVSERLEQTLSLSVEEQEALADSLISNLGVAATHKHPKTLARF